MILLVGVWSSGSPRGADTWGHLFKAEYLVQAVSENGPGAYLTSAWMPDWYMGDPFRTYYPPLTTLLLTPIVAVAGSPALAHKLFATLALGAFGALAYWSTKDIWGRWPAALASTLIILAPYQLRTLFFEGNYPRVLALLALPAILWATEKVLTADTRLMPYVIALGGSWAWAILAHPQQAYMFTVGFGLYVMFRLFLETDIQFRRAGHWSAGLLAGAMLASPWALPAYSRLELANVPFLPSEKVELFAAPLSALLPALESGSPAVHIGLAGMILGLLAAVSRPEPRRLALVLSSLLTIWFSFGPPAVAFSLLPLSGQLLPERFLNFAVFGLAMSAGGLFPLRGNAVLPRAVVILGLVLVDLIPVYPLVENVPYPAQEAALQNALQEADGPAYGRTAMFAYPEPRSREVYFAAGAGPIINGWALENTPHHEALRRYLDAPTWADGYLQSQMSRWAVDLLVLRGGPNQRDLPAERFEQAGFAKLESEGEYRILRAEDPPSALQIIPDGIPLVVGDKASPFLATFPSAEESTVDELSRVPPGTLERYPLVGLYNFETSVPSLTSQIGRLDRYLRGGGVIVTDLSGMEDDFGRTLDLFGIDVTKLSFSDPMVIEWEPPFEGLPAALSLSNADAAGWTGATYQGLDTVLAAVQHGSGSLPVLGYKDVGEGRIWVIGLNLLYYAQQSGLDELTIQFREVVEQDAGVWDGTRFPMVHLSNWKAGPVGLSFDYEARQAIPRALISYTYSPRLHIEIDGNPAPTGDFEHLLTTALPAGSHRIDISYRPFSTFPPVLGLLVGLLGVAGLAGVIQYEKARFLPAMPGQPEPEPKTDREYAPCANCGFLMSEVGPPTGITYPFQVVHCPICGLSMDDDGFHPGEDLDPAERAQRLADWLDVHGYNPETVHQRWGFEPEQFFGEMEGAQPPELPGREEGQDEEE